MKITNLELENGVYFNPTTNDIVQVSWKTPNGDWLELIEHRYIYTKNGWVYVRTKAEAKKLLKGFEYIEESA